MISDEVWGEIKDVVPAAKHGGRPAKYSRRELLCAILYIICNEKPWRSLPSHFPPWNTVYVYYRRWRKEGIWQRIVERLSRPDIQAPCDLV